VSALVGFLVEAEWLLPVRSVGDYGFRVALVEPFSQLGAVVCLVGEKLVGRSGPPDETLGYRAIVSFAASQEDGKKTALSICKCVDLRIAPAT
jgi:hypothetical protein